MARVMLPLGLLWVSLIVSACAVDQDLKQPNLILISLDTLRADHVGCYGYSRPTTPAIDAVASKAVIFERTVANAPWTLPSHASMLTGLQPRHHGVRSLRTALPESIPTLAMVMKDCGYETMAIVNSRQLLPRYGLHRGFSDFKFFPPRIDGRRVRSGREEVDLAIEWVSRRQDAPFFLFLHNYDVHSDYNPSAGFKNLFVGEYRGSIRGTSHELKQVRRGEIELSDADLQHLVNLYDAGIREVDADLARLFDFLEDSGLSENTVLVLTSDHGEEFLEHGGVLHGRTMFRELLSVPLIISGPGVPEGVRVDQLAQPSDIFATVLDLMNLPSPRPSDSKSLVDSWSDGSSKVSGRRVYAEADHNRSLGDDTLEMVQTDRFKLIFERPTAASALYDLRFDPEEQVDVAVNNNEIVNELLRDLQSLFENRRSGAPLPELPPPDIEALRALGYID